MPRFLAVAAAVALFAVVSVPASAQRGKEKEPRRPQLAAGADTNDARVYYVFGNAQLARDPEKAADAFYWSARLEPLGADAFYARRIAMLLSDKSRLMRYWRGDKRTIQSDEIRRIDSMYYRALTLNPFISQRLERQLFEAVIDEIASDAARRDGAIAHEIRYEIDRYLKSAPPAMRAWAAYAEGRYTDALDLYTRAVKDTKNSISLRVDRGRLFYQMNQPDSALADFTAAVEEMRKRDKKDLVYVYDSKALMEHSIATLQQRLGHTDLAREALGRALQEDLAYFPAHIQLAYIALDAKDTTTALSEMDLATQLRDDDEGVRYLYGFALAMAGRVKDAEPQLRKAIELNAVYAAPHLILGRVLEVTQRKTDAVAEYRAFLTLSGSVDMRRREAEERLAALSEKNGGGNGARR
jgi:tetratricopeptide (TPR) repeat protein